MALLQIENVSLYIYIFTYLKAIHISNFVFSKDNTLKYEKISIKTTEFNRFFFIFNKLKWTTKHYYQQ